MGGGGGRQHGQVHQGLDKCMDNNSNNGLNRRLGDVFSGISNPVMVDARKGIEYIGDGSF